jgi:hypothetical protein
MAGRMRLDVVLQILCRKMVMITFGSIGVPAKTVKHFMRSGIIPQSG